MGVLDGQPVNQSITNPAFINKNQDDTMPNKLGFSRALSGSSIADIQQAVNNIYLASGVSEATTGTAYTAPPSTITVGDNYQLAFSKLAQKFDPVTGHVHTGSPGDAPPITAGDIVGAPLLQFIEQGTTISSVTGGSTDVSTLMVGKTASSSSSVAGVVVNAPNNRVFLTQGAGAGLDDVVIDSQGNLVYGKLTHSGSVWTVTYFSLISAIETPYSFATATSLRWFFRELFDPLVSTPNYEPTFELFSRSLNSIAASGATAVFGNAILAATGSVSLSQSGQTILITGSAATLSSSTPQSVGSSNNAGAALDASRSDHAHQGVHSLAASGNSALYGNILLVAGTNVTLTQSSQNITIAASGASAVTTAPDVQKFTSASGTYTVPANAVYLHVEMVGAGGGGSGSGSGGSTTGGNGTASTFGTSLLSAGGGTGGTLNGTLGGAGGTSSLGSGPTGLPLTGGDGGAPGPVGFVAGPTFEGGNGGSSAYGGAGSGSGGTNSGTPLPGKTNTGGGGGGAGAYANGVFPGAGGGAGGFVDAYISGATLSGLGGSASYVVGAGGAAGGAGTSGVAGASGGSGVILITAYF